MAKTRSRRRRGGDTSTTWLPTSIAGCKLWLDCWREMHYGQHYADNDAIGQLTDWSGNGSHVTQATAASKPIFKTGIVATRPVARFDGSDDELATASMLGSGLVGNTAGTVFILMSQTGATGNGVVYWSGSGTNILRAHLAYTDTTIYLDWGDPALGGRINAPKPGGWANAFHVVTLYRSAGQGNVYVDGVSAVSGTFTSNLDGTASASLYLGSTAGSNALTGDIAEVIFYNSALTAANHNVVGQYLANKYGLTWTTVI